MYTSNNQLCIFISEHNQLSKIDNAVANINDIDDIFLTSDSSIVYYDKAILPTYFIRFYDGKILFMCLEDWLSYKDNLRSQQIYVVADPEQLINANLSSHNLKNIHVINI